MCEFNSQILRFFFQLPRVFLHHSLKFSVSSTALHLVISGLHLFKMFRKQEMSDKHDCKQKHTHTRVDPHGNASSFRSPVACDVFTLVLGDCYFCMEPDNSIIHCGCWCTHFTSLRKGAGVCFQRVPCVRVYVSIWACTHVWGDFQQKMNCWHATPNREERSKRWKGKGAVINMAIKGYEAGGEDQRAQGEEGRN